MVLLVLLDRGINYCTRACIICILIHRSFNFNNVLAADGHFFSVIWVSRMELIVTAGTITDHFIIISGKH